MSDDPRQMPLNDEYEQERAMTRAYVELVERRLADLVDTHLAADVKALMESGGADSALKNAVAELLKSGELDDTVRHELRGVLARNESRSTQPRWRSWPSLAVGSVATVVVVFGVQWVAGVFSDRRESPPGRDPVVGAVETSGATIQPAAGEVPGPVTADDYIRIFDERFGNDRAWSQPLWTELAARGRVGVPEQMTRWLDGEDFDRVKIRRAMVLLILQDQGLGGFLDGEYRPDCAPNNCVIVRDEWLRLREVGSDPAPPLPPDGDAWRSDPNALEPFEKFLVAWHLESSSPDG